MEKFIVNVEGFYSLPCIATCIEIIEDIRNIIFPGYFDCINKGNKIEEYYDNVTQKLQEQISRVALISQRELDEVQLTQTIIKKLPEIASVLKTDLEAFYLGDPAATDSHEIIVSYPGFFAITVYRIAHILYQLNIPYIPRIFSEHAHSKTGIDIHPGCQIGHSFFIDHGTGIVIGETAIIGDFVRIYQNVTIGALSLGRGQLLKGTKRHPTIGNHVTIYSSASILGGTTIIGDFVTIGSNTYIINSIPANSIVRLAKVDMEIIPKRGSS